MVNVMSMTNQEKEVYKVKKWKAVVMFAVRNKVSLNTATAYVKNEMGK
jgi:hypothetical protein